MGDLNRKILHIALRTLDERLSFKQSSPIRLVICGGSALIALDLVSRTTSDVDVVALVNSDGALLSPVPFPKKLSEAIHEVAVLHQLPEHWLNNDPSSDEGGLFQDGLPEGLFDRAHRFEFGTHLSVYFIDRFDQIHLKVYAAADSMGVHVSDLMALEPSPDELEQAARWCMKHDTSDEFRNILRSMFEQLGYENVAARL